MLPRRSLLLAASALTLPLPRAALAFQLVTPQEVAEYNGDGERPRTRAFPNPEAPVIEVVRPQEGQPLSAPVTIQLRFRPQAGAPINPASFQASYGAFGLDITQRLLQYARVDPGGMVLENVAIPAGSHRITLKVADAAGRTGERTFRFTVAG